MASDLRSRLIAVGADKLADALLELAERSDDAADAVDRIGASAGDNLERFRAKLDDLRRSGRFYDWRQSDKLAGRLQAMLQDLEAADPDPRTAVELMIDFLATDGAAMESCDDSSGWVGDVFTHDACETFSRFARQIDDVDFVTDLLVGHLAEDEYGLRLDLVDHASDFLAKPGLELLVDKLSRRAEEAQTDTPRMLDLRAIESLALQLGDPALFERTRLAARPISTAGDAVEIATAYLNSGQPGKAIDWLQRFDDAVWKHQDDARDLLLLAAYTALDDRPSATEVAWRRFHKFRDEETLGSLIHLIGEEQREAVIADEGRAIAGTPRLSLSDADFLIQCRRMDEAESYILARADQLRNFGYHWLLAIAEPLDEDARHMAATIVYRALLDSVLERGKTAAYHHGARYLRRLEAVAPAINDWKDFPDHSTYVAGVRETHGRKRRFWQIYEEAVAGDR